MERRARKVTHVNSKSSVAGDRGLERRAVIQKSWNYGRCGRHVEVNSVPGVIFHNASVALKLGALLNLDPEAVVGDGRYPGRMRKQVNEHAPAAQNQHSGRVTLDHDTESRGIAACEDSSSGVIAKNPTVNACFRDRVDTDGIRTTLNRVTDKRAVRVLLTIDRVKIDAAEAIDCQSHDVDP